MRKKQFQTFYGLKYFFMCLVMILPGVLAYAQDLKISGKVSAANATPLSGVTIRVKDKQTATTTDANGNFTINAAKGSTLVISYVGYIATEQVVGNSTSLTIKLDPANKGLDEVVVVGYGSKRKRDITSAISTINMAEIGEAPSRGITQLIQG